MINEMQIPEPLMQLGITNEVAEQIARTLAGIVMVPEFSNKKIPVKAAAKIYGKSEYWVRKGILEGWLPIGHATESENRINVYISPKKLWENTGFIWKGEMPCE